MSCSLEQLSETTEPFREGERTTGKSDMEGRQSMSEQLNMRETINSQMTEEL